MSFLGSKQLVLESPFVRKTCVFLKAAFGASCFAFLNAYVIN